MKNDGKNIICLHEFLKFKIFEFNEQIFLEKKIYNI